MANNEDNRQYTVITSEIERQKKMRDTEMGKLYNEEDEDPIDMIAMGKYEYAIRLLESLLPKEREIIEAAYNKGHEHTYSFDHDAGYGRVEISISSETYFKETFKQMDAEHMFSQTYTQDYKTK